MNRKGFTMIELLMVIVIIAVLSAIMIPNIIIIINKNDENNIKSLENNIISATKEYVNDNKYTGVLNINCTGSDTNVELPIKLSTLKESGYIKGDIKNPTTKDVIDPNKEVNVTFDCNKKNFTYSFSLEE